VGQPFRLLVTGSRTWHDIAAIEQALAAILDRHPEGVLLVHGACPRGADAIAAAYAARTPGYRTAEHPADWHRYGRAAGYRRNAEMIALGADGCAAFIRGGSPGSTSTVRLARAAGIPVGSAYSPDRPGRADSNRSGHRRAPATGGSAGHSHDSRPRGLYPAWKADARPSARAAMEQQRHRTMLDRGGPIQARMTS